jgi:hypothetical protein
LINSRRAGSSSQMSTVARKPAIASMVRSMAGRTEVGCLKSPGREADIGGMALHDLPAFDPGIIERYVENTYRKANAVFLGSVVAGVMIGAALGATPLTSLGANWPIPRMFGFATMIVGAIVGGAIGYLIGDTRSFLARLQGQTALAQIEAAKDARLALEAVQQIQALATRRVAAAAKPQHEAAPVPAPPPPVTPVVSPIQVASEPDRQPEPAAAPVAVEAAPQPVAPVELASVPASAPVELVPPPLIAPFEAAPPPAPVEAAPVEAAEVEAVPAPPALELAQPPAPPTLVVASASPEAMPPVTPPLSS